MENSQKRNKLFFPNLEFSIFEIRKLSIYKQFSFEFRILIKTGEFCLEHIITPVIEFE